MTVIARARLFANEARCILTHGLIAINSSIVGKQEVGQKRASRTRTGLLDSVLGLRPGP